MPDPTPSELSVRDPLSEVTRKKRRLLLGMSILCVAIAETDLLPEKISTLGIDFTPTNKTWLIYIVLAVTAYFLSAFVIYAAADFVAWRIVMVEAFRVSWNKWHERDMLLRHENTET
jgi:hypothetical protein